MVGVYHCPWDPGPLCIPITVPTNIDQHSDPFLNKLSGRQAHSIGAVGQSGRGVTELFGVPTKEVDVVGLRWGMDHPGAPWGTMIFVHGEGEVHGRFPRKEACGFLQTHPAGVRRRGEF